MEPALPTDSSSTTGRHVLMLPPSAPPNLHLMAPKSPPKLPLRTSRQVVASATFSPGQTTRTPPSLVMSPSSLPQTLRPASSTFLAEATQTCPLWGTQSILSSQARMSWRAVPQLLPLSSLLSSLLSTVNVLQLVRDLLDSSTLLYTRTHPRSTTSRVGRTQGAAPKAFLQNKVGTLSRVLDRLIIRS